MRGVGALPRLARGERVLPWGVRVLPQGLLCSLRPSVQGSPLASPAVLLCPSVGAPRLPAHRGLLPSSPAGVPGLKPSPRLFLLLLNNNGMVLCSGSRRCSSPTPKPMAEAGVEALIPSPTPPKPISGGAGDGAGTSVGKAPCRYSQEMLWLPVQRAASSRVSRAKEKTFMSNPGLGEHQQLAALAVSGPPRATFFSCQHLSVIYPPARLSMTPLDSPRGKNRPEILIKGNQ